MEKFSKKYPPGNEHISHSENHRLKSAGWKGWDDSSQESIPTESGDSIVINPILESNNSVTQIQGSDVP